MRVQTNDGRVGWTVGTMNEDGTIMVSMVDKVETLAHADEDPACELHPVDTLRRAA